jgi:hypothetical protein
MAPSVKSAGSGLASARFEKSAGGLLCALDVGLVERVDAQDPAGDSRGDLPHQQLGPEGTADLDLGA